MPALLRQGDAFSDSGQAYCCYGVALAKSLNFLPSHPAKSALAIPRPALRTIHTGTRFAFNLLIKIPQTLTARAWSRNERCDARLDCHRVDFLPVHLKHFAIDKHHDSIAF
jgi:hypothetical protein